MKYLLFSLLLLLSLTGNAQRTILHCGKLVQPELMKVSNEMSITIEGKKIVAVQKGYIQPSANENVI
ncbi:MAG: amidohydrolase family protein, partial [Chitinophagaceae bacterium]